MCDVNTDRHFDCCTNGCVSYKDSTAILAHRLTALATVHIGRSPEQVPNTVFGCSLLAVR